jgi:hypothetical protein
LAYNVAEMPPKTDRPQFARLTTQTRLQRVIDLATDLSRESERKNGDPAIGALADAIAHEAEALKRILKYSD